MAKAPDREVEAAREERQGSDGAPAGLLAMEEALLLEEAVVATRLNANRRRLAVVRAKLDRIAQQRAVSDVDRILGLE